MKSLDFMIVGVQKAGTSALSHFLSQHPQVDFAKGKEVHLFDAEDYSSEWSVEHINARYEPYFEGDAQVSTEKIRGESTPIYMYWPEIAEQLKRYSSQLKLIIMLRDPAERALSHYAMEYERGNEFLPFWLALIVEPIRLMRGAKRAFGSSSRCHSYVDRGIYIKQLKNLRRYFSDDQILIIENKELLANHKETMAKVCQFLDLSGDVSIQPARVFSGDYAARLSWLSRLILHLRLHKANKALKRQLIEMGYSPKWPWLG